MTTDAYFSISELSRKFNCAPRFISDLFYQRKVDESTCIHKAGRRLIPVALVPKIRRALREAGKLSEREPASCK